MRNIKDRVLLIFFSSFKTSTFFDYILFRQRTIKVCIDALLPIVKCPCFLKSEVKFCQAGGTVGGRNTRLLRYEDPSAKGFTNGQNQSGIFAATAHKNHIWLHLHSLHQHSHFDGHGTVYTGKDIFCTGAFGNP